MVQEAAELLSSAEAGQLAQPLLACKWEASSFPGLSLQQLSLALKSLIIQKQTNKEI